MSTSADVEGGGKDRFSLDDAWWGAAMITPGWVVLQANQAFADILGVRVGDLVGHSIIEVIGEEEFGPEIGVAQRLLAGESPLIEFRRSYDLPGGRQWEGTVRASLLRDAAGEPEVFHVRFSEPGTRRPPERIAWREGDFPLALDAMTVGVAIIGLDGTAIQANRAMCEITGRSEEELQQADLLAMTHPDDRTPDVELGTRAWLGELDTYTIEKRIIRPDGSLVWVRQEITFARDENGRPVHLIGQVIDISDRKAIETELARSRQELADLVEEMPIGLLSSGPDGLVITANQAAAAIAGVPEMPRGFDVRPMIHPDDFEYMAAVSRTRALAGADYHVEYRVVRPDGSIRWVRNDARPQLAADGSLLGIRGTWLDVTDLKEAEAKLRRQATHDALTGLANRHLVFDALAVSIERCEGEACELSVLFVDLDGFKAVNDSHGHGVGDRVLVQAAQRIAAVVGDRDVVARFGGDEFIVHCERTAGDGKPDPTDLAHDIIEAVRQPFDIAGQRIELGASVGIATWTGGDSADDLVNAADRAVYLAKAAGRNCWRRA